MTIISAYIWDFTNDVVGTTPDGWVNNGNGTTKIVASYNGETNALEFDDVRAQGADGEATITKTQTKQYILELDMTPQLDSRPYNFFRVFDSSDSLILDIHFNDGYDGQPYQSINVRDGSISTRVGSFAENNPRDWYHFKLKVDRNRMKYSVWLNNSLVINNYTLINGNPIGYFQVRGGYNQQYQAYYDNILLKFIDEGFVGMMGASI